MDQHGTEDREDPGTPEECADEARRAAGRPRDEARTQAILEAAYKLLCEEGLAGITTVKLAKAAGVSTATLYRWWPSKEAIVLDGYLHAVEPVVRYPEAPSSVAALRAQLGNVVEALEGRDGEILASFVSCMNRCPEVREAYRERFLRPLRADARRLLDAAVAEGDLRPEVDRDLLLDALYGPIYYRLMIGHLPLDRAFIAQHFELIMSGARTKPSD